MKAPTEALPNETVTATVIQAIVQGRVTPIPLPTTASLPLRGKISTRGGRALHRTDIPRMLDRFLADNPETTIFVVQGGNRHVTRHILDRGRKARDMKLVCASKVSLATILRTVLDPEDLSSVLHQGQLEQLHTLVSQMPYDGSRQLQEMCQRATGTTLEQTLRTAPLFDLLGIFADDILETPFGYPSDDSKILSEFEAMHGLIEGDELAIPHLEALRTLLEPTKLRFLLAQNDRAVFIDDLFYRGRTLFTIACVLKAFGIAPTAARLYTLCADRVSHGLESKYITVMNNHVLYPFENSIRSERGYWQHRNGRFRFMDLEDYWQYLAQTVNTASSEETYETWQSLLEELWVQLPENAMTKRMTYALLWYLIFHIAYELPIELASLVDQRSDGIGYCVAYARIIDNFISQEESVDKRTAFKGAIHQVVRDIWALRERRSSTFDAAVSYYRLHSEAIDYEGLTFMFDIHDYGI